MPLCFLHTIALPYLFCPILFRIHFALAWFEVKNANCLKELSSRNGDGFTSRFDFVSRLPFLPSLLQFFLTRVYCTWVERRVFPIVHRLEVARLTRHLAHLSLRLQLRHLPVLLTTSYPFALFKKKRTTFLVWYARESWRISTDRIQKSNQRGFPIDTGRLCEWLHVSLC